MEHTAVTHAPLVHVCSGVHVAGADHWALALHVSTPLPEHCVAPGVQTPVHWPALQTKEQLDPLCQVPVASQVSGKSPLHWRAPGVQLPTHLPPLQA